METTKIDFRHDTIKIEKRGIIFRFFHALNTKTPHLILQMSDKKGNNMSIALDRDLAFGLSKVLQRYISEM